MEHKGIKSKERVVKYGEVFTPAWLVSDMLDLVGDENYEYDARWLEPACGNGNFLVEIYRRKLEMCGTDWEATVALMYIYGVDIQADNCEEARARLLDMYGDRKYRDLAKEVVRKNIQIADMLTGRYPDGRELCFIDWVVNHVGDVSENTYTLSELLMQE